MKSASKTVFLHGFSGEGHSLETFARVHSGSSAVCVDLPGFGTAPTPSKAAIKNFDIYCDETWQHILRQVPANTPLRLVGHSYGAMVAFNIARRNPDSVAQLDLYCPVAAPKRGPRLIISIVNGARRLRLPTRIVVNLFSHPTVVDVVTTTMLKDEWSQETKEQIKKMRRHEATLYQPVMFDIMRHSLDFFKDMHGARTAVPTRICHATDDTVAGTHDAAWYQSRTATTHIIQTTGGHLGVVAEPKRLGRIFEAEHAQGRVL